jgi:hypothetical protein
MKELSNPIHIIEGHLNRAISGTPLANTEVEQLSAMRMARCNACPELVNSHCRICGCNMHAKTRALSATCPKRLW